MLISKTPHRPNMKHRRPNVSQRNIVVIRYIRIGLRLACLCHVVCLIFVHGFCWNIPGGQLCPQPTWMCENESDGHRFFWLQVSEVSGHVSTQNGSQICPFTPDPSGGFLWTLSTGYGCCCHFTSISFLVKSVIYY